LGLNKNGECEEAYGWYLVFITCKWIILSSERAADISEVVKPLVNYNYHTTPSPAWAKY